MYEVVTYQKSHFDIDDLGPNFNGNQKSSDDFVERFLLFCNSDRVHQLHNEVAHLWLLNIGLGDRCCENCFHSLIRMLL